MKNFKIKYRDLGTLSDMIQTEPLKEMLLKIREEVIKKMKSGEEIAIFNPANDVDDSSDILDKMISEDK